MKRLTVGKMDLFDLLRRVIYPALDENLDKAFPEFQFQKGSQGWWLARNSPSSFRDYGHPEGKLVAKSWGFRSLVPDRATVFWLAYVNKQKFPDNHSLPGAIRDLASRVNISCVCDASEDEMWAAQDKIRCHLIPEALLDHFQGVFWSKEGESGRKHLIEKKGFPENKLLVCEFGFYASADRVRWALNRAGLGAMADQEKVGATGIYQPHWEGRIIGPSRDVYGKRVVNLWGYRFPFPDEGEPEVEIMRPIDLRMPIGSRDVPYGLHGATQNLQKNLLVVESPLSALAISLRGLQNPWPIATMGPLTDRQVGVLEKYLKGVGSLTLNLDYSSRFGKGVYEPVFDALDLLRNINVPIYVVDPKGMKIPVAEFGRKSISPEVFIREKGIEEYVKVLKTRVPIESFNPEEPPEGPHEGDRFLV